MRAIHLFWNSAFIKALRSDTVASFSAIILLFLISLALFAPLLSPHTPYDLSTIDILDSNMPPAWDTKGSADFLLGTDNQGRDVLSSVLYGLRLSVIIGIGAVVVQVVLGVTLGLIAGYKEGLLGALIMRIADIELSFSTYIIAIFSGAIIQASCGIEYYNTIAMPLLIGIIGISEWPQYARTVRAKVLSEKKKEYVEAARVIGLRPLHIMWKHILPNSLSPVLVICTVQVANAVMSEAALSFLGLGMPPTQPSLGSLIKDGFHYFFSGSWWIIAFPSLALILLIVSINSLGDFVRDYLNPRKV